MFTELEMRLESVKVANEIYEDQLNDLQKRLDDSVVEMRHNSTCTGECKILCVCFLCHNILSFIHSV